MNTNINSTINTCKVLQDAKGAVDMLAHLLAMGHISEDILPYADQQEWKDHLRGVKGQLDTMVRELGQ